MTVVSATKGADPLLQPFQLKNLTLKNRIMSTSHACGLDRDGYPQLDYQLYHEEKAKGGIALTMFGGSSNVAPDSPSVFRQLYVGDDGVIPHLQAFSTRVHAHGAALMCQITHLGRRGHPYAGHNLPTIGPSMVRETLHRSFPKEMDAHDIARVVAAYGAAAKRCKEGGLDGIETLTGAHLIGQFLSPLTNRRTDRFGGSIENRCRFGLMVHEEIRRQTGDDFIVGIRFVVDEGGDGLSAEDCIEIARIFEAGSTIDFFNGVYGRMDTATALAVDNMPGMASPIAPWLSAVGAFKREVKLPVFHAARIADIATARYAISEGLLDMVAMTRAHIADPHIVRKIEAGEEGRIRPCVGATHCMGDARPACLHNASTGRERDLPHQIHRADRPGRKVVIVGAGPAGLEAARVCGERGHYVVLFEAAAAVGGQVRLGALGSWRKDLIGVVDWRAGEIARLGVDLRLNRLVEPEDIWAEQPEVVIIATGGVPDLAWLDGAALVDSVWDILAGQVQPAADVLIYDGTGRHPAPACADYLAGLGKSVRLVCIDGEIGADQTYAEQVVCKQRLYEQKVGMQGDHRLTRVQRQGNQLQATFINELTGGEMTLTADQVVVEHGTEPVDDLFRSLRGTSVNDGVVDIDCLLDGEPQPKQADGTELFELYRIGDAVASRNIRAAILDAFRLSRCL